MTAQPTRVGLVSLGCPKNLVDSEVMIGSLLGKGYVLSPSVEECDIALINTCAFIGPAQKESVDNILELAELKTNGTIKGLIVMGCLSQKYGEEIKKEIPEIDAIIGTGELEKIVPAAEKILKGETLYEVGVPEFIYSHTTPRFQLTSKHTSYLKVSEGCNHTCAFCVIPQLRGTHRSRTIEDIVQEATRMGGNECHSEGIISASKSYSRPLVMRTLSTSPGLTA